MRRVRRILPKGFALRNACTAIVAVAFVGFLLGAVSNLARAQGPARSPALANERVQVIELRIGDEIEPVMAEDVDGGIEEAARRHASLVLITMDTPGGLSTSMEDIIQHILDSPVPVVVYISPAWSRGASPGYFILLSADVAAMAPGTHTGAASPLLELGGVPLQVDETLKKKILNDATAFLRSYSAKRGRNVELAESAVTEGKAWTETEALDGKLVDLIANSPEDLLSRLDGRAIKRFDGTTVELARGLFIREAKYTSHGVLAIGGIVAMLLGALMLVRSPLTHAGVSLGVATGVTLPFALIKIFLMRLVLGSRTWKPATGREQLVGPAAEVTAPLESLTELWAF